MRIEDIPDAVEAFLDVHFQPLNPFYPADEDAAIVARSMAKVKTVAAHRGMSPDAFSDAMGLMEMPEKAATMREINTVRVDPRTGGGLS
jgi:hypothetical protein